MNDIEFREYFTRIESYFALKREQLLLLSPEEFQIVEYFFQQEIPVELVLRGIDRFFEKKKKRKRKTRRTVFLTHIQQDIEEIAGDYKRKGIGSHLAAGPTETEFILDKLHEILEKLNKVNANIKPVAKHAETEIRPLLKRAREETMEEIEKELERIYSVAKNDIFATLNPEIEQKVEERIQTILEQTGHDISPDIRERFKTETTLEILGFPVISIYS